MLRKRKERFVETEIDDELVIMDIETGDFLSLEGPAREIWALIDGSRDRAAIVTALASDYAAGREEIASDVDAFVADLQEAGLVDDG